jgi:hypothetical protein
LPVTRAGSTAVVPTRRSRKVERVTLPTAWSNTTVTLALRRTPVAPGAGVRVVTAGARTVVKLHVVGASGRFVVSRMGAASDAV